MNDIQTLHAMLSSGDVSSEELTRFYISEIEKSNPVLNSFVYTDFGNALESAKRADKRIKEGKGSMLTGIPFALKDNICTEGVPTTCCSKILSGFRPCYDATAYYKLKAEGAVLLGKTNMDEFAMGSASETSVYGAPLNPVDLSRVAGGSSGGSAAAVRAGLAPYALGSDTGGSVRQPASFCGVVGFKPSYGAVSRYGLIAYGSSLDQIGTLTLTVKDAAFVFDAVRGADSMDMTSSDIEKTPLSGEVGGLRIAVVKEFFEGLGADIKKAVLSAIEEYEKAGAQVGEVSLPSLGDVLPVYYIIACAEASSNLGRYDGIRYGYRAENYSSVDEMIIKTRTEGFGKEVQKRIMLGTYVLSSGYYDAYYKKARILRERVKEEFKKLFGTFDVIMAPTVPQTAFPLGFTERNPIDMYLSDVCTVPANIAGLPAVSVPCGEDAEGLPVGLQIIGDRFKDYPTLSAALFADLSGITRRKNSVGGGVK